jgi:uncharacterized protein (TIGR02246 family)
MTKTAPHTDEAEVRSVIYKLVQAVRAKDVEAMLAQCTPDFVAFDMIPPLVHEGADAMRRIWARTLESFVPPLEYGVHDLHISIDGNVAFARSVNRFGGTSKDDKRTVNWVRTTFGLRRVEDRWLLEHQHVSVPFDMDSGQARLDLAP